MQSRRPCISRQLSAATQTSPRSGSPAAEPKGSGTDDGVVTDAGRSAEILRPEIAYLRNDHLRNDYKQVVTYLKPINASEETLNDKRFLYDSASFSTARDSISYEIASAKRLKALTAAHPLPDCRGLWRKWRHLYLSYYIRLWTIVIIVNLAVMLAMISRTAGSPKGFTYSQAATAAGANLLVAALMRHEHCVNMMFSIACCLPQRTPLFIRRRAAKVYSYGAIHSGCGISALLWYVFYTVLVGTQFQGTPGEEVAMAVTTSLTQILLALMVCGAHPKIRRRWHNQWELSHRYGGWMTVALFWAQILVLVIARAKQDTSSVGRTLVVTPAFWFLVIVALVLIYPWLRLRRRKVRSEKLSDHAVRLHFEDRTLPTCKGYRLSHSPLLENHGFATIPNAADDAEKGYSIVVSNAGDWTKALINNPPDRIWTRGAPTTGVMRIASLFKPIIVVATGSGIGPCLSYLQVHPQHPMRIIWSARSPQLTYGEDIMRAVVKADRRAIIVDTKQTGHPDLPALTYAMWEARNAEAVVVISNPVVTRKVVYEMEARGVPAFGAIFDS